MNSKSGWQDAGIEKNNKHKHFAALLNIMIPLIVGLAFYILCRPKSYISVFIRGFIPDSLPSYAISGFINDYLADLLWSYATAFAILYISAIFSLHFREGLLIAILAASIPEFLQCIEVIDGTFDPMDIVVQLCGVLIAAAIIHIQNRKRGKQYEERR